MVDSSSHHHLFFFQVIVTLALMWITIIGCSLSIVSLLICVYVFTVVRGMYNLGFIRQSSLIHTEKLLTFDRFEIRENHNTS